MRLLRFSLFVILLPAWLGGQVLNNASLTGKYYFVHLLGSASPASVTTNAQNLSGSMVFDGSGGFTYQGQIGSGADAPIPALGNGVYTVAANGFVTLGNPIVPGLTINARLGDGAEIVLGASTEALDGSFDLFVAVRAPAGNVSDAVLNGEYTGGLLASPDGTDPALTSALIAFVADGAGMFPAASAIGHARDLGDVNLQDVLANVTYSINGDGTGTVSFGSDGDLLAGGHDVFVSANGNYLLGSSTEPGGRQIFLAIRNFSESATDADWEGDFWIAEVFLQRGAQSATTHAVGAVRADGDQVVSISERSNFNRFPFDFSGINFYIIDPDSRGALGPTVDDLAINMVIGAPDAGRPMAFVGAQVDGVGVTTNLHGIFFGVRLPSLSDSGVFLNPLGVINGASFAMPTFPISGGAIVALFGSGMAPEGTDEVAQPPPPLATTMAGVSVTVDGVLAPLFSVRPGQINIQIPFGTTGPTAIIIVNNNGTLSNPVEVPVAATSPGVFSVNANGLGPGAILDLGGNIISSENPAAPDEFVSIFLTGLGAVNPPVADGVAGPAMEPLPRAVDPAIQVLFGSEAIPGEIQYAGIAPNFAGLYQINVRVPNDPSVLGAAVPLLIQTTNACSDFVDIAVAF